MSQEEVVVQVRRLPGNSDVPLPSYQTGGSVAMDLHAAVAGSVHIAPGEWAIIPCGFEMAVPVGYEAQVRPRSGLAAKEGLTVLNSPGTIDSDYRGEIKVILINLGTKAVTIERSVRIAQLLVTPVPRVRWEEVTDLADTARGSGGFGHTGK